MKPWCCDRCKAYHQRVIRKSMKKIINTEYLGYTLDQIEEFIREEMNLPKSGESDYLGYKLHVIVELIKE